MSSCDVTSAFCQSDTVRWQNTFASWITTTIEAGGPGFLRAENAGAVYRQPPRSDRGALLLVIYVDDIMLIGKKADQQSFYVQLNKRFQCQPVQWLEKNKPLDHLGITIHEDDEYVWMSMENYIKNMLVILNMQNCQPMHVPFTGPIVDLKELCEDRKKVELNVHTERRLLSDSDMAGNGEGINKRRSQLGYVALLGKAPITWSSKVSSVMFGEVRLPAGFLSGITAVTAHPDIAGEHVATSSAEAETYALGIFANEVLYLSYVAEEAGIPFPRPAVIQVDNLAAIAFSKQSQFAGRSKLRHIDCRAEWLKVLRDSNLVECVHVS